MNIMHILKVLFRPLNLQEQWHRSLRGHSPSYFLLIGIMLQKHWCMGTSSERI